VAYASGLLAGFAPALGVPALVTAASAALVAIPFARRGHAVALACTLLFATGTLVAIDARRGDAACAARAASLQNWSAVRSPTPCAALESGGANAGMLEGWRDRIGARIDTLFGRDAPLVRALLIADKKALDPQVRDRFAAAGLMHILSLSGLHVAILARVLLLALQAASVSRAHARWVAFAATALYVAAIGAPASALRSALMLGIGTCSRTFQRPVSPWAALALGAGIPLVNPRTVTGLGWQMTVAGFASLTAAGIWCKRHLPHELRGWKRSLLRDVIVSTMVVVVTAPLVAWAFGRVSLVAPLTNVAAGPVIALLEPALFLAVLLWPLHGAASFVADAAHPLLAALDRLAQVGAAIPFGALSVAPSLAVAASAGVAAAALVVAAVSRRPGRPLAVATSSLLICAWWPIAPTGSGEVELHVIDVGQGDAVAIRTPPGRWILVDAGRTWPGGDAGRTVVVPYLRRFGGDLALFILTHPHADHVGGAATVLRALHPLGYRDAAFAGGSESYRHSLAVAGELGVPWARVHPGDALVIDGVSITFLAPDSAWTARLTDPNLASTVTLVRYRDVRFLLTGDAEAPEEAWLLAHLADSLRADVLKVAHHGSRTSSTPAFLDHVRPRIAVVSVGVGNTYGHPSPDVMRALLGRGTAVLRTDQLGTVVVGTDGHALRVSA
ncbi:MAG TPA: DNA internalization-related competence protein ComEC/Rec2, partial [Gemmatimonadaceae bacterium]|nr:DNA internalization-related competence protein ComEC/Rec2 [Gemmatimonadaceae bacterium]